MTRRRLGATCLWLACVLFAVGCRTTTTEAARARPAAGAEGPHATTAKTPSRTPSAEAYRAVLESELLLERGDASAAAEELRIAVLHDPSSPWLRVRLGELLLTVGDIEGAREAAEAALERAPRHLEALRLLATTWILTGEKQRAESALKSALKTNPGDRAASTMMAELLLEDDRVDDAEAVIEQLMSKEPDAIDGWLSLARLFGDRGEVGRAHVYVDRALERQSRSPEALALKVDLLHAQGRFADALPIAETLARERGDSPGMRRAYLTAMLLAGARDAARALAGAWLDDDKSEGTVLLIAGAYEAAGLRAAAREQLRAHGKSAPGGRVAVESGRLALDDGDTVRAATLLCAVGQDEGAEWFLFARSLCARALVRDGKTAEAIARLEAALVDNPSSWRLLLGLVDAARRERTPARDASVKERCDNARLKAPDDVDLLDAAVRAHESLGDPSGARALLQDALKERPDHAQLLLLLARFLERQGDATGAVSIGDRLLLRGNPSLELLNFLAFTLADHELRAEEAERLAWRALLHGPLNGYVVDTLGWALFRAGKGKEARLTLQRADLLSPDEPEILLHLAEVQRSLGLTSEARATVARTRGRFIEDERVQRRLDALANELAETPS